MSQYIWGTPPHASFQLVERDEASDALDTPPADESTFEYPAVTSEYVLYVGVEGEGVLIEGDLADLAAWTDRLSLHVTNAYRRQQLTTKRIK